MARGAALAVSFLLFGAWLGGLAVYVRGIFTNLDEINRLLFLNAWTPSAVRAATVGLGAPPELPAWVWLGLEAALVLSFGGLGVLLLFRKQDAFGIYLGVAFILVGTHVTGPVSIALGAVLPFWSETAELLSHLAFLAQFSLLYVFPDGRLIPRWGGWLALAVTLFFAARALAPGRVVPGMLDVAVAMFFLTVGLGGQVYRYLRRSGPVERQQVKWVVPTLALLLVITVGFATTFPVIVAQERAPTPTELAAYLWFYAALSLASILFVVSLGIAILRYRLWQIDVIIRRTLVYSLVTALLALVYGGMVVVTQALLHAFSGEVSQSPLAVVLSTLASAALFNPLRKRIQAFIDRRFYRRRYNAERTLTEITAGLRQQADLAPLSGRILTVVDDSMQPESLSLWLVKDDPRRE